MPPNGNLIVAGDDSNYYKAYTMTGSGQPGQYALTLNAQKTGAYRLTARYKVSGNHELGSGIRAMGGVTTPSWSLPPRPAMSSSTSSTP